MFGKVLKVLGSARASRGCFGALAEILEQKDRKAKVRNREGAIASTRGACAPQIHVFARSERAIDVRTKYTIDASASTIPVTTNSRAVACLRIQKIARIASAGTIFMPGKLKGSPSERTSRCTKTQQPAQQSRYINNTATFESTASCSKVPLSDSAKASVA